jgi:hypothetical protein
MFHDLFLLSTSLDLVRDLVRNLVRQMVGSLIAIIGLSAPGMGSIGLTVPDADAVMGSVITGRFTAPFYLGKGGVAQIYISIDVQVQFQIFIQTNKQVCAGRHTLQRFKTHAVFAVIACQRLKFMPQSGAEK